MVETENESLTWVCLACDERMPVKEPHTPEQCIAGLVRQLAAAREEAEAYKASYSQSEHECGQLRALLQAADDANHWLNKDLNAAREEVDRLKRDQQEYIRKRDEWQESWTEERRLRQEADAEADDLESQLAAARAEVDDLNEALADLREQFDTVSALVGGAQEQRDAARAEVEVLHDLLRDALKLCWGPGWDAHANYALKLRIEAALGEKRET